MRLGPFGASEIGIIFLTFIPWLVGLALAIVGVVLLLRLVRANERIADALDAKRVGDAGGPHRSPSSRP
jgi:hypothetical protein